MLEKDKTYSVRLKGIVSGKQIYTAVRLTDVITQYSIAKLVRPTIVVDNTSVQQQAGVMLPLAEVSYFYVFTQGDETVLIPESWIVSTALIEINKTLYLTLENISTPLEHAITQFLNEMKVIYKITK